MAVLLCCLLVFLLGPLTALSEELPVRHPQAQKHAAKALESVQRQIWSGVLWELKQALRHEPQNAYLLLELGKAYSQLEQWKEAREALVAAARLNTQLPEIHFQLGIAAARTEKDSARIASHFEKVLQLDATHADAYLQLASLYWNVDDSRAREFLEKAHALAPGHPEVRVNLALLEQKRGATQQAIGWLEPVVERSPELVEPQRQLAGLYAAQGRHQEAVRLYRRALQISPQDRELHYALGQALLQTGEREEARLELARAREIRDREAAQKEAGELLGAGLRLLESGRAGEAISKLQAATLSDPRSGKALMHYGLGLAATGRLEEAHLQLQRAAELEPEQSRIHHNLGTVYLHLGNQAAARKAFERALELDPYFAESHNNLGLILFQTGRPDAALNSFRTACELDPGYLDAAFNLGLAHLQQGRLPEAEMAFRSAVSIAPEDPRVYRALAEVLAQKGDGPGSAQAQRRAEQLEAGGRP